MRKLQFDAATFDSTEGLFAVVVARDVPRQGGSEIFSEAVAWELPWREACKRVTGILTGIGKPGISQWGEVVDARIYAEMLELPVLTPEFKTPTVPAAYTGTPETIPRPWSAETLGAYQRDTIRRLREELTKLAEMKPAEHYLGDHGMGSYEECRQCEEMAEAARAALQIGA